jgi:succinate dehydrogenase flavin-adding protein (antitoxin of CptAB toxin-antitoxin module)
MLELDIWLNRFLDDRLDALPIARKQAFVYLLQQDDMTLFDWLSGSVEAPPDLHDVVDEIRAFRH